MNATHFLGLDPGRHGAFAILNQEAALIELHSLPTLPQTGFIKTRLNARGLRTLLVPPGFNPDLRCMLCAVENVWVRPTDSHASGAALVQSAALAEGVLVGLGALVIRPTPQQWRKAMLGDRARGKEASLERARALWPTWEWVDDNKAEAALLARFAWLNRNQDLKTWEPAVPAKKKKPRSLAA